MKTCTFFGHRDAPQDLRDLIKENIIKLIVEHGVELFYVGNHGRFDSMVRSVLKEIKIIYPQIEYAVVLAYFPKEKSSEENTILPEGIELCHPRFAIDYRNQWMMGRSDFVISYVTHSWGGAYKFCETTKRRGKTVINIAHKNLNEDSQE